MLLSYFLLRLLFIQYLFFFFKQKTAYEMRISDWSSDVCSSDLKATRAFLESPPEGFAAGPILTPRGMLTIATEELVGRLEAMSNLEAGPRTEPVEGEAIFKIGRASCRERVCT